MAFRKHLLDLVSSGPRSVSSLARELHADRHDMEEDLRHMITSARAAGHTVIIEPARCKTCGFVFDQRRLSKPGKCPQCAGSRIFESLIKVERRMEE